MNFSKHDLDQQMTKEDVGVEFCLFFSNHLVLPKIDAAGDAVKKSQITEQ